MPSARTTSEQEISSHLLAEDMSVKIKHNRHDKPTNKCYSVVIITSIV